MFDEIRVQQSLLPEPFNHGPEIEFQTKCLENRLHTYTISNGMLFKKDYYSGETTEVQITDTVHFYGNCGPDNKGWVDFLATFENGALISIKKKFISEDIHNYYMTILKSLHNPRKN